MARRRYTIIVEDSDTGVQRRYGVCCGLPLIAERASLLVAFTLSLRRVAALLVIVIGFPVLVGVGARWTVRAELDALRANAHMLDVENAGYRVVTKELTGQIESLQTTLSDLGQRSKLDPASAKAMAKLPSLMKAQSMGGGTDKAAIASLLSPTFVWTEDTFGALRNLLGHLENRLRLAQPDVEKRQRIAAATPTSWPAHGWVSATFGMRADPFTGVDEFHSGLDISTDKGAPVFATADGRVESAAYNGAYGNMLVINHGFGLATRYAHLSGFKAQAGAQVQRGDVIGFVGSTGRATGPHLHYEILLNGALINPYQLLFERRP
jgi:murein DD-endopeptidase MepM/ murein hydrolase activator NlpD